MKKILFLSVLTLLNSGCHASEKIHTGLPSNDKTIKTQAKDSAQFDYSMKINGIKSEVSDDFIVKGFSYFVVASNLTEKETQDILDNTIAKAVSCFHNDYFEKKPDDITTIFLFKDDNTYRYWAKKLYGDDDLSRFGYYKPGKKVMLMNISTGTGTLVHEMTHALVRYDFPDIPSWFNEGLGSLYERSSLSNNQIIGYVNWRLPALQKAISDNSYTPISSLVKTNDDEFYGDRSDVNYAQARYLCMYLQENGLLKRFYKAFRDNYRDDNTGKTTLEKITGKSLSELDNNYIEWVKTLKYEQ